MDYLVRLTPPFPAPDETVLISIQFITYKQVDHHSEDLKDSILNNLVDSLARPEEISPLALLCISDKVLLPNSSTTVVPLLLWEWLLLLV